ncbi:hypothetical protein, partial [Salmonella enterica]|uniref:hypothetical protein n=1 Tax=Salmonella enterica TaxID=28901 RepID=UPI001A9C4F85
INDRAAIIWINIIFSSIYNPQDRDKKLLSYNKDNIKKPNWSGIKHLWTGYFNNIYIMFP